MVSAAGRAAFAAEMHEVAMAMRARAYGPGSQALERAHVLGQNSAWLHVRVHWAMLRYGWRHRDAREVRGQLARLLLAAPASWLRLAPVGNTGGADVGLFTPMPIPEDLKRILSME